MDLAAAFHSHLPCALDHGNRPHGPDRHCRMAIATRVHRPVAMKPPDQAGVPVPRTPGLTSLPSSEFANPVVRGKLEARYPLRPTTSDAAPSRAAALAA
jgi:hypothetical protein